MMGLDLGSFAGKVVEPSEGKPRIRGIHRKGEEISYHVTAKNRTTKQFPLKKVVILSHATIQLEYQKQNTGRLKTLRVLEKVVSLLLENEWSPFIDDARNRQVEVASQPLQATPYQEPSETEQLRQVLGVQLFQEVVQKATLIVSSGYNAQKNPADIKLMTNELAVLYIQNQTAIQIARFQTETEVRDMIHQVKRKIIILRGQFQIELERTRFQTKIAAQIRIAQTQDQGRDNLLQELNRQFSAIEESFTQLTNLRQGLARSQDEAARREAQSMQKVEEKLQKEIAEQREELASLQ